MKPYQWYLWGILPLGSIPMNAARYITEGKTPTAKSLAAGMGGSMAVAYALGKLVSPNIPQALMYHKMRMLGFGIPGIHPGKEIVSGLAWRMPVWARAAGWSWAAYGAHLALSHKNPNTGVSMYDVLDPRQEHYGGVSWWG